MKGGRIGRRNGRTFPTPEELLAGRDALYIYAPLAHQLGMHKLKSELEGAAFAVLYRRQHRAVHSLLYDRHDAEGGNRFDARGIPKPPKSPLYFASINSSSEYVQSLSLGGRGGGSGAIASDTIRRRSP